MGEDKPNAPPQLTVKELDDLFGDCSFLYSVSQDAGRVLPQEGGCVTSRVATVYFNASFEFRYLPVLPHYGREPANGAGDVSYVYSPVGLETVLFGLIYLIQHIKQLFK